jgi:hypothetical protein
MNILLVAPNAPPKNSAESIQVGRFLAALDPAVRVTLVTTPGAHGWVWQDSTLASDRPGLEVVTPTLPFHRLTQRILSNRHLSALHVPDSDFWLPWYARWLGRQLKDKPDVIYSRSAPFSAALLAQRLKDAFGCPWLMHLSDPWAGSPYHSMPPRRAAADRALEAACMADADLITLTTEGQAAHYRANYPDRASAIAVTPNMMPLRGATPTPPPPPPSGPFRIVYTGALYGDREPSTLLSALRILSDRAPNLAEKIAVDFFGNMPPDIAAAVDATPGCTRHGVVSSEIALQAQLSADVLLTIEPDGGHPLHLHFMPSKNLDYIACGKPILAITPLGSETSRLCAAGHGWAMSPGDSATLAERLSAITHAHSAGIPPQQPPDLTTSPYRAEAVASSILQALRGLLAHGAANEASA